jgi:hypothetical protein
LKAESQGKAVTIEFALDTGKANVFDLREAFKAPAKLGSFGLAPFLPVSVRAGEETTVNVKIKREEFKEPVELTYAELPSGLRINETTIAGKDDGTEIGIVVGKDVPPGQRAITIKAQAAGIRKEGILHLNVQKALAPGESSSFTLEDLPAVTVKAGGDQEVAIKINRNNFEDPVEITCPDLPAGLRVTESAIPGDESMVTLLVVAGKDVAKGEMTIKLVARGSSQEQSGVLKVSIE